jgi:hypothetical protein
MKISTADIMQVPTPLVTRRRAFALTATSMLAMFPIVSLRAGMPLPVPLNLEDQIKYHGRLIFTGRLRRAVFLSPEATKKLFTQGLQMDPAEIKLYGRDELKTVDAGFLEIENAFPILLKGDISAQEASELATGTVYCYVEGLGRHKEMDAYITSLAGSMSIFFFNRQTEKLGVSATSFPVPLYLESSGNNWRDALPRPVADLPKVTAIAKKLGFVDFSHSRR